MSSIEILLEKATKSLPETLKKNIHLTSTRKEMKQRFGNRAFLLPEKEKFPVINPETGKIDCRLVYAAYVRANQWSKKNPEYKTVASKAKTLFSSHNCGTKLDLKIESTIVDDLIKLGLEDLISILPKECIIETKNETIEYICDECGFVTEQNLNKCLVCESELHLRNEKKIDTDEKMKGIIETLDFTSGIKKESDKYFCESCNIIVKQKVAAHLENKCPKCKIKSLIMITESTKNIENGKRNLCPRCKTSYKYIGSIYNTECIICKAMTIVV